MDKELDKPDSDELEIHYRSLSKAAVGGTIFAFLGLGYLLATPLILLPVIGLGLSWIGVTNVRRFPEELVGRKLAKIGLVLSILLLAGGTAWHTYVYMTEVPEGYERISFRMLKPDRKSQLPYSPNAEELDGTKVFLKGYVRPGTHRTNLRDFILVGDFGSCCFGGNPEITDVVAISIQGEERVNYSLRVRKIAGTFRLNRRAAPTDEKEVPKVYYQIDAEIVK
ncbi:MAG: DUF3299 domain-containing protein [Pirellulaceae bacterium]